MEVTIRIAMEWKGAELTVLIYVLDSSKQTPLDCLVNGM
jgi:hypothetical protein